MRKSCLAMFMVFTLATTAHAGRKVYVQGAGTCSCAQWLKDRKAEDTAKEYQYQEWIRGYVSGRNWDKNDKQTHLPDDDAITAFLDQYCKNNLLDDILLATLVLMQESGGPKTKHKWNK